MDPIMVTPIPGKFAQLKCRIFGKLQSETAAGSIFRNMAVLVSGSVVARGVALATMPVITRIYTPDHMGVLSVFTSMTEILIPLGTLRYSAAIPLPRKDGTAANLFALCMVLLATVSLVTGLVLWFFAPILLQWFSMSELLPFWWLVVPAIAGAGFYEVLSVWAMRDKSFNALSKSIIWQSAFSSGVKIGLGLLGFKPLGLLIGQVMSQASGCTSLTANFYPRLKAALQQVSVKRMTFVLKRYADFPAFRLPSQFLLAFSASAPLLFSAMLFGKETTGQLGLALTTIALPIALFGNTTGQAYYAEIAKIGPKNPDKIHQITKSVTRKLFLIAIPPFLLLLLAGPWLFTIVFGKTWGEAGLFARILSVYLLSQFVSNPLMNVLNIFNRQRLFLSFNVVRSVLILIIFGSAWLLSLNATVTIIFYSIFLTVHYLFISKKIIGVIK